MRTDIPSVTFRKLGFYAPLPPARTGVADYAAALLRELRRLGPVEVSPQTCDIPLYHLGNNALHADIYRRALQHPGIAVLHDAVLNHFLLGQLAQQPYIDEFVYNYGEWNRGLGAELWRARAGSAADARYFCYPMLRRIAETSRAIVVHNPAAADAVRGHAAAANVVEIPHLFAPPDLPSPGETMRYRQRLGIPEGTFLFGIFGYLRESKRLISVLEAFDQVRREIPHAGLLVAGHFASSDLQRAAGQLLVSPGIWRLEYLEEPEFWLAASSVDACINLRFPSAGETSGIAVRLMGIGKPLLVTASPEYAHVPEGAVVRIDPGLGERESLRRHMILLTSMSEVAREIGLRGAAHIRAHHRVEEIAKRYWELLCGLGT